jgi:dephospho-CoA kinase
MSTDEVVRQLYAEDEEVRAAVLERFGTLEPGELAQRAFATTDDRRWLEQLLWPRVGARMVEWRAGVERAQTPPRAAIVEVPLLFESGMEGAFEETIAVVAAEALRAERAAARGHQALAERTARQLSQEEKARRATFVVENDGTEQDLEEKLSAILDMLAR